MDQFIGKLNSSLMAIYQNINRLEEQTIKNSGRLNLTINEMHMIEYIGRGGENGRIVSDIAGEMNIKSPSVTVAVKKLVAKGYLEKHQSQTDGRVVHVRLTRAGKRIFTYHRYYLRLMINELICNLNEDEKSVLVRAFDNLNLFLANSISGQT